MKKFIGLALLSALALFVSCREGGAGEEEAVDVSLKEDVILLASDAGEPFRFEITSNVGWSIKVKDLDWLAITPLRRLASTPQSTVTLTASPNTALTARRGTFAITAGSFSKTVTVEQAGTGDAPSLIVTGVEDDLVSFRSSDTPRSFTVSCNADWTATAEGLDWCGIAPLSGAHGRSATITLTPQQNESSAREGTLSIDYGADAPYVLRIAQTGFEPVISLSATTVQASDTGRSDPSEITVTSNGSWTAVSSEPWVTLDKLSGTGNDTVTPVLQVNESSSARTATITFDNHGLQVTLTVTQRGKISQYITVDPATVALPGNGVGVTVNVTANTAWKVTSTESWITVTPATGTGNGTVTISATPNQGTLPRTATVGIVATEVTMLQADVAVSQEVYASLEGWVDLEIEKVIWDCTDQAAAKDLNPDFASAGQNGTVSGMGTGIFVSSSHPELAVAKFSKGNTVSYTTTFIISTEGHYAFKKIWQDDAIEFHVPVVRIVQGETLHFNFGIQATAGTAAYYRAEVSFDGGTTFLPMDTGQTYSLSGGRTANVKIQQAAKAQPCRSAITAPSTVELCNLIARIIVADHQSAINGNSISAPNNGTLRVTNYSDIDGPTIYLTK